MSYDDEEFNPFKYEIGEWLKVNSGLVESLGTFADLLGEKRLALAQARTPARCENRELRSGRPWYRLHNHDWPESALHRADLSQLPSSDPNHLCGMFCDGQDGSNSNCAMLRRQNRPPAPAPARPTAKSPAPTSTPSPKTSSPFVATRFNQLEID